MNGAMTGSSLFAAVPPVSQSSTHTTDGTQTAAAAAAAAGAAAGTRTGGSSVRKVELASEQYPVVKYNQAIVNYQRTIMRSAEVKARARKQRQKIRHGRASGKHRDEAGQLVENSYPAGGVLKGRMRAGSERLPARGAGSSVAFGRTVGDAQRVDSHSARRKKEKKGRFVGGGEGAASLRVPAYSPPNAGVGGFLVTGKVISPKAKAGRRTSGSHHQFESKRPSTADGRMDPHSSNSATTSKRVYSRPAVVAGGGGSGGARFRLQMGVMGQQQREQYFHDQQHSSKHQGFPLRQGKPASHQSRFSAGRRVRKKLHQHHQNTLVRATPNSIGNPRELGKRAAKVGEVVGTRSTSLNKTRGPQPAGRAPQTKSTVKNQVKKMELHVRPGRRTASSAYRARLQKQKHDRRGKATADARGVFANDDTISAREGVSAWENDKSDDADVARLGEHASDDGHITAANSRRDPWTGSGASSIVSDGAGGKLLVRSASASNAEVDSRGYVTHEVWIGK